MNPHKFTFGSNGTSHYDYVVFCEYCGHIAFHANTPLDTGVPAERQRVAKEPCPRSPETNQPTK